MQFRLNIRELRVACEVPHRMWIGLDVVQFVPGAFADRELEGTRIIRAIRDDPRFQELFKMHGGGE